MSWEYAADNRIERYRKAEVDVRVETADGKPVRDAHVAIEMQRHAFTFGTAVNAEYLVRETEAGDEYRTTITDLFNTAVLENRHKWGFWEEPEHRELAEAATEWVLEQGLEMRGHTCIWQQRGQGAIPDDVVAAMDEGDRMAIERRTREHIAHLVGHYGDVSSFNEWDVLNEQVAFHEMTDILDPSVSHTETPHVPTWFRVAQQADPDADLYINEYNILVGDDTEHKAQFEAFVTHLLAHDVPLDGVGMQAHHSHVEQRRTPAQLLETLDRFGALVPSIQIQEYDTWGAGWTEELEAAYLYQFLKTVYSHPVVEGFLMWGIWDTIHWQENAPLFRDDWSKKPAYDVYTGLVFDEWWTSESGETTRDGHYRTSAFLGKHQVTVIASEQTITTTETFDDPESGHIVSVQLQG